MWLLAELFEQLPEVGDLDKPKLVFLFDEAHLLFADASKAFLQAVQQTVKLIRSKGVGVFFCTQMPTDVPGAVLSQLGARIQHALRAFTPDDQKALSATVKTYPITEDYQLASALTSLGTGEAIVTVLSEKGAPTPVAWTRVRAPRSQMAPAPAAQVSAAVAASALMAKYGQDVDRQSAYEMLTAKVAPPGVSPANVPTVPTTVRLADVHRCGWVAHAHPGAVQPVPGRDTAGRDRTQAARPLHCSNGGTRRDRRRAEQPGGHLIHEITGHVPRRRARPLGVRHPEAAPLNQPVTESAERSRPARRCPDRYGRAVVRATAVPRTAPTDIGRAAQWTRSCGS